VLYISTYYYNNKNWPTAWPISDGQRPTSDRGKKFPKWLHAIVTLLYQKLQSKLGYNTVIRRRWVMAARCNITFKIPA